MRVINKHLVSNVIIICFLIIPFKLPGQKKITVKDEEIEFTFTKPLSWKISDDGYNYVVVPYDKFGEAGLNITYFENDKNRELNEIFKWHVDNIHPLNTKGFEAINTGDDTIGLMKAKWIHYRSTFEGIGFENIQYFFLDNGQVFVATGIGRIENFQNFVNDYIKIIRSIRSKRLK